MKKILILVCFLVGLVVAVMAPKVAKQDGGVQVSSPEKVTLPAAASYALPTVDGGSFNSSQTLGKVVILNFWATWCPPCRAEIPDFVKLYDAYKDQGVEIVGIALDDQGASVVAPFVEEYGINYTVLIGNRQVTEDFGGIRGIPTTFVINQQGNIYKKYVGYQEKAVFEQDIQALLPKLPDLEAVATTATEAINIVEEAVETAEEVLEIPESAEMPQEVEAP